MTWPSSQGCRSQNTSFLQAPHSRAMLEARWQRSLRDPVQAYRMNDALQPAGRHDISQSARGMWVDVVKERCGSDLGGVAFLVGMRRHVSPEEVHIAGYQLDLDEASIIACIHVPQR